MADSDPARESRGADSAVRAQNARLADSYDTLLYEEAPEPALDPSRLLSIGKAYGCNSAAGDILDLGCGAGVQLQRAGLEATGRLVGVDLGKENCRRAIARCAAFGKRAEILNADFLDVSAEALGMFDVIYAVGALYIVPPNVREHLLALIAKCLRPGGVAVLSYYSGTLPAARAYLHGLLRSIVSSDLDPSQAVAQARHHLPTLARQLNGVQPPFAVYGLQQTASLPDATFYHEVFNPFFTPLHTSEIQRVLSAGGIDFLRSLNSRRGDDIQDGGERAFSADAQELGVGGYYYNVFGRRDLMANKEAT